MRLIIVLSILSYALAFGFGYYKNHNVTAYVIYFVIQVILFIMQQNKVGYSGKGDAAGNGMEAGLLALMYYALQGLVLIVLIVTFVRKML